MADLADLAQEAMESMASVHARYQPPRPLARVYEWCIDCDDPIDPARLKIVPTAERCSDCQHDYEHYLKRHGG